MSRRLPGQDVVDAFGLEGVPVLLPGGQGDAFRVGDVVVKRAVDAAEAEWTQDLLLRIEQRGFRSADPVATVDGGWTHDGWLAHRFIPDLRPAAPDWDRVAAAGLLFCDAADAVRRPDGAALSRRTHRWAVADRVAWGEQQVPVGHSVADLLEDMRSRLSTGTRTGQFIHGDLSGNVFIDDRDMAVILDVSPYIRPREWCVAIVVADAVLWYGADVSLMRSFARDADRADLVVRALIFRLMADELSAQPTRESLLARYRLMLAVL
jgi:uncharacterized protein (TIGR02569 family)